MLAIGALKLLRRCQRESTFQRWTFTSNAFTKDWHDTVRHKLHSSWYLIQRDAKLALGAALSYFETFHHGLSLSIREVVIRVSRVIQQRGRDTYKRFLIRWIRNFIWHEPAGSEREFYLIKTYRATVSIKRDITP